MVLIFQLATKEVIAIGYGRENFKDILSYGNMTVQPNKRCLEIMRDMDPISMLCVQPSIGSLASVCEGDSGGTHDKKNLPQIWISIWILFQDPLLGCMMVS
jgi:hypothetical protein